MEKRKFKHILGTGEPMVVEKNQRNARCKCGSGKKQKHCCGVESKYFHIKKQNKQNEKQSD